MGNATWHPGGMWGGVAAPEGVVARMCVPIPGRSAPRSNHETRSHKGSRDPPRHRLHHTCRLHHTGRERARGRYDRPGRCCCHHCSWPNRYSLVHWFSPWGNGRRRTRRLRSHDALWCSPPCGCTCVQSHEQKRWMSARSYKYNRSGETFIRGLMDTSSGA